ncbi:hypothetical protein PINS_up005641 [Pythium insidiosum]|nr:hypothetical protein PINS_up005641 [Pythium insidiosum]
MTTTRRRLSSASLPSNRSTRAPSLRHFKHSPTKSSPTDAASPVTTLLTPGSGKFAGLEYPDGTTARVDGDALDALLAMDEEDEDASASGRQCRLPKEFMFAVAALVVLLTSGGLILGFGPVYSALVREQQWSEVCDDEAVTGSGRTCAKQEIRLQYVFSTSFLCLSAANAFFGVFLDVAGPRWTALVGLTMSTIGNFALAIGDSHTGQGGLIIVGYALIGAGGMGSYLASFQLLQLFEVQGVVCSALSSLFNCSGYLYMMLQVDGVERKMFFHVCGFLAVACMCLCYLLFPTNNIIRPRDTMAIPGCQLRAPRFVNPLGLFDGMREELKRPDLWYFAVYFGWLSLIFAFAGGAIPSMLSNLAGSDPSSASLYINYLYPLLVNGTFVYSPVVGYVIDHFGFKVVFVACLALVQAFVALLLVPSLKIQIVTFLVYAMAQASLYALQFAYIMICFPPELYGTLQAFLASASFVIGMLNYLLNPWTQEYLHGDYTTVLLLLVLPTFVLYAFVHHVKGCEEHTIKYDQHGNPIIATIIVDEERHGIADEKSQLLL